MSFNNNRLSRFFKIVKGPLTYNHNGRETVVGVVSWSLKESRPDPDRPDSMHKNGTLSVYARVTSQLDWISKEIEKTYKHCHTN